MVDARAKKPRMFVRGFCVGDKTQCCLNRWTLDFDLPMLIAKKRKHQIFFDRVEIHFTHVGAILAHSHFLFILFMPELYSGDLFSSFSREIRMEVMVLR